MKEIIINEFKKLIQKEMSKKNKGYIFKINQYKKLINALQSSNIKNNVTLNNVYKTLNNVFKNPLSIKKKIKNIYNKLEAGNLKLNNINKDLQAISIMESVPQIGPSKAKELVEKHKIYTINQLKKSQHLLNEKQKLGLNYYDELIDPETLDAYKIPRSEIKKFENIIKQNFNNTFYICGSYRRGKSSSGDIDLLATGSHDSWKLLIQKLKNDNILKDSFSSGSSKWMGMGLIDKLHRRIDLMFIDEKEFPFALLYFTGSKEFNKAIRYFAKKEGYTLNEHGIKLLDGSILNHTFHSEKDIFDFLNLKYKEPSERNDSKLEKIYNTAIMSPMSPMSPMSSIKFNSSKGVLLAHTHTNENPVGYYASEKYDGIRALWNGTNLLSRTNKIINAPSWFIDSLPKQKFILDGELFGNRASFDELSSIVSKKQPIDTEWRKIKYMVFDITNLQLPFKDRFYTLEKFKENTYFKIVKHILITNKSQFNSMYKNILNKKGEGIMLRDPDSFYVQKRSKSLLKVKPTNNSNAIIYNFIEGKGKNIDSLGAFVVQNENKKFKIGTGFTSNMRKKYWSLKNKLKGKVVTYTHKGVTSKGIPRHPSFLRFRENGY